MQHSDMQHHDETFRDERVELHGRFFHRCTFEHCELVFDGDRPPSFGDNVFRDCTFALTGAAARTMYMLQTLHGTGAGGRDVVERLIDDVRTQSLYGHELHTAVPSTPDRSLA